LLSFLDFKKALSLDKSELAIESIRVLDCGTLTQSISLSSAG
jgi:hypothetical protein